MERTTQTSADLWTCRDAGTIGVEVARGVDLAGFSVEAADGGIGKIDEATYDTSRSFIVVDTGPWIFGKKVMLPAGVIYRVDPEAKTVYVDRSNDEIKNAPELHESRYDEDAYKGSGGRLLRRHLRAAGLKRRCPPRSARSDSTDALYGRPLEKPPSGSRVSR